MRPTPCGSETILLVEDENQLREIIQHFLETKGYVVLSARTPADAIELSNRPLRANSTLVDRLDHAGNEWD